MRALLPADVEIVASVIGDTPQSLIPFDHLRRGIATGWLVGPLKAPAALVIQNSKDPTEPSAFGHDPAAVWSVLRTLSGWECVNVPLSLVDGLRSLMLGTYSGVRVYRDAYYVLSGHLIQPPAPPLETRLLSTDDLIAYVADPLLADINFAGGGVVAAAFDADCIVAIAHVTAISPRYADIGVYTLEPYRNRGLSTYVSWLVMRAVLALGLTPVWSTGEDNVASQRVAERLGLTRDTTHRAYLIP